MFPFVPFNPIACTAFSSILTEKVTNMSATSKTAHEQKTVRFELRVSPAAPAVKETIQRAMAVSGLTAGDIAYQGARQILKEHEQILLIGEDKQAFLDTLLNPPEPTDKLVAAFRRHRQIAG